MVNSLTLHSRRKSPLWVAAYCFSQLKRAQVFGTDIASTVDKIVRDEIDVVSYRVLSYLLIALVRIYSRQVDYLASDCDQMLIRVNNFFINRKEIARARMSVTIPDRFKLDEFNLDALEDPGRSHIASKEDITLQDVSCTSERFGLLSLEKFDEFDVGESSNSVNHLLLEDIHKSIMMEMDFEFCNMPFSIDQPDLMGQDLEVFRSNSPINLLPDKDMDLATVIVDVGAEEESPDLLRKDKDINADEIVQLTAPYEDQIPEKSRKAQEESVDISMILGTLNESVGHDDYSDSMEIENSNEGPRKKLKFKENFLIEDVTLSVIPPLSENIDATPQSMLQGDSVGRPTLGDTTPNFTLISTPALTEGSRLSRKRKTIDKTMIISNNVLKKSIQDASKLVFDRGNSPPTLLRMKKSSTSRKSDGLRVPLVPSKSSKQRFIFLKKKLRIRKNFKIGEPPRNSRVAESKTVRNPKAASPKTPPRGLTIEGRSIEHPPRAEIENSDNSGPLTPHVSIELDQSPKSIEGLNPTEEFNVENTTSCESFEKEQNSAEDDDLNLMNELSQDISSYEAENSSENENSSETENLDLIAGWSAENGNLAKSLQVRFQDQRNKQEEEVVNFFGVVQGQTRKDCAKLFYQVLVLKNTRCVDVEQNDPYGDIAIKKQPKLDETLATYDDGM